MTEAHEHPLFAGNIVIDARNNLVVVSASGSDGREVVGGRAAGVGCRPETQQLRGCRINPGRRDDVV